MATLTLDEFLTKARPLNPEYSDSELIQAYQERYAQAPTQTVSPAPLMTLEEFLPKAKKLNPEYSDDELTAAWQEKYGARGAREQDQGDLGRGFKESFQQVPQMAAGVAAGLGAYGEKLFGEGGLSTALKNTGIKNYREIEQDISRDSKPSDSLTEAYNMARSGDAGALVDWLQHGLGYVGGQGLQALATAGIGSIAGKMMLRPAAETLAQKMIAKESARLAATGIAGDQLKRQAVSNVAGKIGQIAALGTAATAMEGGEIHGDLVSQAEQEGRALSGKDLAIAFATTLGAGALEFVGDKLGLDLILGRSVASRLANSRLGNATISGTAGAVVEAGTEAAQTPLEQIGKGQDPRSPESIKETVDSAALGGLGGAALGAGGGLARRPEGDELQVTDRTPPERKALPAPPIYGEGPVYTPTGPVEAVVPGKGRLAGLGPGTVEQYDGEVMPDMGARRLTQAPQPGEYRNGTVYGGGDVVDVSPLPDITPVTKASSLDEAIANAVGVVQGATETAQARAAEFARMTAKAKNETDALLANAPEKRTAFTVPTLPGPEAQPPTLLNQPSPIVPGQAFTPRSEPIDDPRARLAEERARMVAQREQQRLTQQANPVSAPVDPARSVQPAEEGLLPSQLDLAYPSSNQVRDLIHEKGLHLDTPVFKEILRQVVKKESFADLTPQELQRLADRIQTIKAPQQPAQAQEAPPQVPLTPAKKPEKPYAPVTTIPEAQVPRSELTSEKNAEVLLRAEKAKADMEIAGTERGGRFFQEQPGTGSTQEVTGMKSATADWYRELTSGPSPAIRGDRKQSAREKIEVAIAKIIKDQGADRGKAVEQVKAALLKDQEFHRTEWGRDLASILEGEWPSYMQKPAQPLSNTKELQATENTQPLQNVPKRTTKENGEVYENMPNLREKSGRNAGAPNGFILSPMQGNENEEVQGNPSVDQGTAGQDERQELRSRLQGQGEDTQKAVPEMRLGEGGNASRGLQQADAGGMAVQALSSGTSQPNKVAKVPLSRTERLAQQKQKMEEKNPTPVSGFKTAKGSTYVIGKDGTTTRDKAPRPEHPGPKERGIQPVSETTFYVDQKGLDALGEFQAQGGPRTRVVVRGDKAALQYIEGKDEGEFEARTVTDIKKSPEVGLFPVELWKDGSRVHFGNVITEVYTTKPEPSPSNAPEMETQPATASPERAPAQPTSEADPKTQEPEGEPFSLTAPEPSKAKAKETGPEQMSIDVPPPTSGERPIIGREATLEEAPLFSKNAQTPDAEQTTLSEHVENTQDHPMITKQDSGSSAPSPTDILASALRQAADQIQGKPPTEAIDTVDKYQAFRKRLLDGEVTLDEYREAFRQVNDNKDALLTGLKKLNKEQLVKISNSFHTRKSESKDSLIAQAYDGMLRGFALGRGVSYAMTGKGSYENAMAKLVEQTTADDLAKFAEEVSKNTAEYKARVQGFLDPKTLEDFDARVRIKGEASLTPEQLARYDELLAEAGREKRKQAQEQKATVQGVEAGTDLQLIESKHTKTGDKLWVVKLANRVDRAVYDRLNQAAHKLGGRYSSYNKDGAIPGFTFRSEEAAKSFMAAGKGETVSAAPVREAEKTEVQNNAVSKLREMADTLEGKADDSLNADRKTNTAKRARQASHADNEAYANKALAETMRNLADAIESGESTHLSGLRTKAQVEMLDSMLERAKYDRIKQETKGSYVDYERQKHRKDEPEDAAYASYPDLDGSKSELFSAYKDLATIKGADRLRTRFYKQAESLGEDQRVKLSREDVELAIEKYPRKSGIPWHWPETLAKLKRLESMGITTLPELRAALREFVEYRGKRGTIDKAKQLERELIGNKGIGNDFFPTPKETAQRMVAEAGIEPGMKVLEPSAGNGNIAEVIRDAGVKPDVVEQSSRLREILEAKGFNLTGQDFLDVKDGGYDRIVMNPPFSNGQDAEHIHHAYTLLKPGGKLVAIAGEGIFFRNDAKATAFRQWLDDVGGTSEKLPEGTFKDASLMATTGVNARMVTIEKPVEEATKPDSFLSFLMDERGSIPASIFGRRRGTEETGTIDPTEARDRLAAVKSSMRPYLLGSLGLEQLSQVYGNDHAEVKQYNKATQAMEADFTEMSRESDKVSRAWTDLNIPVADKMAQVMEDARFLNFDPDPRKKQEADSEKKKALRTRFEQIPEEAQAVYRMARDFYTNMAEQRFQALKERIERAGGTPENTRKLVDRLQIAYEKVRSKVYFPFTRFGENIVVAKQMKDGKEVDREVHAFESVAEAQKFATMMKLKGWTVKQTVAREYSVDKEGPASKIVRQMHDIIKELGQGQQGLPGVMDLENQLLDSLNQSFLQALPDMSYAKHFIHAKDVKGASRDALRSFAHSALHGAHHISRIRHADKVTQALMGLDEKINETTEGDTTEARQVYNELVKRHNDIMNPNTHPVSAWLGQLGFTMSLGGVVATGITNATQVPLVTYPWLGARYGFGKASAALARAYKDFLNPRTLNKDSLFDASKSKLISESERKMLMELARRGRIDLTQTMDLAGLSSQDNLSRKAKLTGTLNEKVTRMLGFTFHAPEVMNRQVTALSTFRLEKEKGGSFEDALQRAEQAIIDTHFIYESWNRPRYMSGNFLRVLTMFKQYSQNIAYTYGRAASIWLDKNNATKEERRVAKRQLASMLTLQFGAAGVLGMPFFGTPVALIMHALGAMDDDDDQDWEVAFRQWLDGQTTSLAEAFIDDKEQARAVGKEMAEVVSHGASRLTPWDMAARLGQNDLFFREPQREREGRSAVMDWMMALGGPVPSYGVNFLLGMGDVAKGIKELNAGFFMRGVEELTPAVLRNGVKSLRYTLEGVRTRDEYKQLDLNTSEQLGQAFGFTPARVAEMYESTTAVKNKEHRILNEQKSLKTRFARAVDDQDDKAKQRILEDIRGFNERNPMFAITSNTLNRSLKTRRQHEAGMERGMFLPPKRRALLEEGDWGDF